MRKLLLLTLLLGIATITSCNNQEISSNVSSDEISEIAPSEEETTTSEEKSSDVLTTEEISSEEESNELGKEEDESFGGFC